MKKSLIALAFAMCLVGAASAQVVITEIMYNPPESGNDSLEYFELHNLGSASVDISGWNFTQGITYTFPAGTIMQAGGYLVLAKNANAFQTVFGFAPNVIWASNDALTNGGEDIELRDASGGVQDYVNYLNALPWPPDANGLGASIVLCDFASDNSLPANWQAATTGTGIIVNGNEVKGNPGAASNCSGTNSITAIDDNISVPTGQFTILNVQSNDLIVNQLTTFVITTPPSHGTASVSGNTIVYFPAGNYCGPDQFSYQICDAAGCDEAVVSLTIKCYPQYSIGTVNTENANGVADSLNVNCELTGTVYGVNYRPTNNNQPALLFTIIDNFGNGISVSSLGGNYGYTVTEKDRITVRGTIGQFNGMTEIRPDTIIKLSADNPIIAPIQVGTLNESTESRLVTIIGLELVDPAEWTTGVGSSGFNVRAVSAQLPNDTILIRIDRDIETYNAPPPPCQNFVVIGLGGQFDPSNPFTSGYQILPRYNNDILCDISTKEADFSNAVRLAPNPAQDVLNIQTTINFDRVQVVNALGQQVEMIQQPDFLHQVQVADYQSGVYFLRFEKDGLAWTTRFVKQ
ncbi:MAG TPA: lamin tail domain-containing protein [Saprospiraceae bacterium]|nr:lamin tail domain-containing protein [Saprospiraceae bacterium]